MSGKFRSRSNIFLFPSSISSSLSLPPVLFSIPPTLHHSSIHCHLFSFCTFFFPTRSIYFIYLFFNFSRRLSSFHLFFSSLSPLTLFLSCPRFLPFPSYLLSLSSAMPLVIIVLCLSFFLFQFILFFTFLTVLDYFFFFPPKFTDSLSLLMSSLFTPTLASFCVAILLTSSASIHLFLSTSLLFLSRSPPLSHNPPPFSPPHPSSFLSP